MNQKFEHLIERAEQLIARIESVLPAHDPTQPALPSVDVPPAQG